MANLMSRKGLLIATSCLLLPTSGCSFLFVEPLPPRELRTGQLHCTTNRAAPVVDTIFTTTNVVSALYVAGQDNVTNKGTAVGLGLAVAALWASSAAYGYSKTSECEAAMDGMDEAPVPQRRLVVRPNGRQWAPPPDSGPYAPPPAPPPAPPGSPYEVPPPAAAPPAPPAQAAPPAQPAPPAPPAKPAVPQSQDNESP